MIILYIVGTVLMIFGVLSIISINNAPDDELPAPKEQLAFASILVTLIGLLLFISARAVDNFISEHINKPQSSINFIK